MADSMTSRGPIVAIGGAEDRSPESPILRRFVEICGGSNARIAIVPTASQLEHTGAAYEDVFVALGLRRARSLAFERRSDCESADSLEFLQRCDGVFFTGGNQLRLAKVIGGTPVADLIRRRSSEGLVVGGTSAGAAILSEHMIAYGNEGQAPRAGLAVLAPGLGVLPHVIVDQHFSQRNRLGRLLSAIAYNPRLIGLGVDENTAAFIGPDDVLEVVGEAAVTIADGLQIDDSNVDESEPGELIQIHDVRIHVLADGARFDLNTRRVVADKKARLPTRRAS